MHRIVHPVGSHRHSSKIKHGIILAGTHHQLEFLKNRLHIDMFPYNIIVCLKTTGRHVVLYSAPVVRRGTKAFAEDGPFFCRFPQDFFFDHPAQTGRTNRPVIDDLVTTSYLVQGGAPTVISWFIIPVNYRYNPHKP